VWLALWLSQPREETPRRKIEILVNRRFCSLRTLDIRFPFLLSPRLILTMRSSILLIAASAVSASVIRSSPAKLPSSAFPKFHTISLEDAINGVDLLTDPPEPAVGVCPAQYNTPSPTSTPGEIVTLTVQPPTTTAANTDGGRLVSPPASVSPTVSTSAVGNAVTSTLKTSPAVSTSTRKSTSTNVATSTPTAGSCTSPEIRREWRSYPTANRQKFLAAIKCLINKPPSGNFPPATNRFEDLARLHQLYMPSVHGNPEFLVWHRYFLWTFEQLLQVECGLDVPMPWWDETKDAGDFASSDLFSSDYFGQLNGPDSEGDPTCVTTGVFANLVANIGPGSNNIPHCLSRSWDPSQTANCNSDFVITCNSRGFYADMESCSEDG
jgi:hypothetical protein